MVYTGRGFSQISKRRGFDHVCQKLCRVINPLACDSNNGITSGPDFHTVRAVFSRLSGRGDLVIPAPAIYRACERPGSLRADLLF